MALSLFDQTLALLADLEAAGVDYALAGALALAVHGVPRATTDIDLLIPAPSLDAALAVAAARDFRFAALPMRFADGMEVRRVSKIEGEETLTLDLLLVDDNLRDVFESRVRVDVGESAIWVISREGLVRMKTWAGRPQDLADLRRLEELDR